MFQTIKTNIVSSLSKGIQFALGGAIGAAIGALLSEPFDIITDRSDSDPLINLMITTAIWFGLIGAGIAIALLIVSYRYLKREWLVGKALKNGLWIGFLAGAIAGAIAQYAYTSIGPTEVLRIICWGMAGGLLGLGLSFRIPNLGRWRGIGGGVIGGLLGGGVFVLLVIGSGLSDTTGRLLGTPVIGFFIGLAIVIIETVFREAWLEIRYNPRESRTVSLGSETVSIGSDSRHCTVYAANSPPVALRYRLERGQILCEDVPTGNSYSVQHGDEQAVGTLTVIVHTSAPIATPAYSPSPQVAVAKTVRSPQPSPRTAAPSRQQFVLHIKRQAFSLSDGMRLTAREIPGLESLQSDGVVAEVNRNPNDPTILGLKNCSAQVWTAIMASGEQKSIDSGRSVKLAIGTKIRFGSVEGEIRK